MIEVPIKNMVCARCIKSVREIFENAGANVVDVKLGTVAVEKTLSNNQIESITLALEKEGFEWLEDSKLKLVERIRQEILQLVHYGELDEMTENLSSYLSRKLLRDYHLLSTVFSSLESTSIEQYFILQKIEKVKEWLVYNEFTLNEISYRLGYSSVAHLSGQFKKITGFTPTQFKQLKDHHRKPIDKV